MHLVRGITVILIEEKKRTWYQNVQNCIDYTMFWFQLKFYRYQNIVLRENNAGVKSKSCRFEM